MIVAVIGTGYVGLVSGTCFADLGNTVICVDQNQEKIESLKRGKIPFYEPGLSEKVERNFSAGRLSFTTSLSEACLKATVIFIAVGTPSLSDGSVDLSAVFAVVNQIGVSLSSEPAAGKKVLVTKSTVPVGTGRKIMAILETMACSVAVVSNPEFLREGTAVYDFFHPDRIVVGSDDSDALDVISDLYEPLYRNKKPIVKTSLETSELSKYASNAFLATKISFINEMAHLCELFGADVKDVAKIMGMDGRIGSYFLHPGPGYGGSCFPKDTQGLISMAAEKGYDLHIVKATEAVNHFQKEKVMATLHTFFPEGLKGKTITLLGLAFKPNTDDIREATSLVVIEQLIAEGAAIRVFDPEAMLNVKSSYPGLFYANDLYEASRGSNAVLLLTEWNDFRQISFQEMKTLVKEPVFLDFRNVYSHEDLKDSGFRYYLLGRPA